MGFYVTEPFVETDHRDTAAELPVCQSRLNRKTHISGSRGRGMFLKDHLGSVLAMTDGAGNIVESYRYDAWGRTTVYSANGVALKSSAIGNRYCWQGREYSWKTGLYYFRARWYEPVMGRWLSNDPIGIAGGLNQYVFCDNGPINYIDPFGEGKVGIVVKTVKGIVKFIKRSHAIEILKNEGTVEVVGKGSSKTAKGLAKKAWGKKIARHDPHQSGWKPHYQPKGGGGHVNYTIPGAALGVGIFGDNVLGEMVDFFNPLSDVQSVVDVLSNPSSLWSDEEGASDEPCK